MIGLVLLLSDRHGCYYVIGMNVIERSPCVGICRYFTMQVLNRNSDAWEAFIHELWELQWTNVYNELTDELNGRIYELSVGNLDLAHRIYREAQRLVIGSGDERITIGTLEAADALACGLSVETDEIKRIKADIALPRRRHGLNNHTSHQTLLENSGSVNADQGSDITKPQHSEFKHQLMEIMTNVNLSSRLKDPDLLQQAAGSANPINFLRVHGVLLDDPLTHFSSC